MKGYKSYKDSGIEWIGEVPREWSVRKLKYLAKIKNGKDQKGVLIEEGGYPVLGTGGEFGRSSTFLYNKPSVLLGRKGTIDKPFYIEEPFWTVDTLFYTEIYENTLPKFLFYLTKTIRFEFYQESSAVPSMTQDNLNNIHLCHPSLEEQNQIIAFLDYKTNLIDTSIDKKKRLIELLKEKRQAIINEAVTKGLNPNSPMKHSGIEYLGEIPKHWISLPFRRICSLQQGLQIPINDRFYEQIENSYEYITTKSIHNPNNFKQYILNPNRSVICNENDVLMGRTGNTGEVVTNVRGVFHNNFFKIDFDRNKFNKDFFVNYLNLTGLQKTILLVAGTTTIPDINHGAFLELTITLPPYDEQLEIVNYINSKTSIIDRIVKKSEELIIKLATYRQSLISEVVTGKIDVRGYNL